MVDGDITSSYTHAGILLLIAAICSIGFTFPSESAYWLLGGAHSLDIHGIASKHDGPATLSVTG